MALLLDGDPIIELVIYTVSERVMLRLKARAGDRPKQGWHITTCEAAVRVLINSEHVHYTTSYEDLRRLEGDAYRDIVKAFAKRNP